MRDVAHAYTYKDFRALFATVFLFQGGFTFYATFIGVYFIHKFNFTSGNIGDFLAYVGLWIVIAQAFILRRLLKYADYKVLRVTVTLTATGFLVPRVLPPQCVVAVAVRGSVFFRCKRALASISYDDCEPLCRRVGSR